MNVYEGATRVKRGAAYLDRRVPRWRYILRRAVKDGEFQIASGQHCVLGTLEHRNALKALGKDPDDDRGYGGALNRLKLKSEVAKTMGFEEEKARPQFDTQGVQLHNENDIPYSLLQDLWLAEIESGRAPKA